MTEQELNKYIHVTILGSHWHTDEFWLAGDSCSVCKRDAEIPEYTKSHDLMVPVIQKIIDERGRDAYETALLEIAAEDVIHMGPVEWSRITAFTKAVGCKLAWGYENH